MAPRLPTGQDLGLPGSLESRRGIATVDATPLAKGAEAFGRGLQSLGNEAFGVAVKLSKQQDAEDDTYGKAKADAQFIPAHTDLLVQQKDNPDLDGYRQNTQSALQAAAANIPDERKRQLWILNKTAALAGSDAQVQGYVKQKAGDAEVADIQNSEDSGLRTLRTSSDPVARNEMVQAVGRRWDDAARQGYITETQAQAAKKRFALRGIDTRLDMMSPEDQISALEGPAKDRDATVSRIIGVESGGNATAKNPNSTATGAGQFTEGTWLATVKAHRPDLLQGRSDAQVLALRKDGALSREMTGYLLDDNLTALKGQGLPTTPTNGYLAHFLGSAGAAAVLKAPPGTPVSDVLGDDQIAANRSVLAGKTVDSVKAWAARKMGESPDAGLVSILPEDQREVRLLRARSQFATQQREEQRAYHEQAGAMQARMSDDIASIEANGQGSPQLKAEDVAQVLGPQTAQDWLAQRGRSRHVFEALDGIASLPEGDIERRLQTLEPKPGVNGFTEDMAAYTKARKKADALIQARRADPALAVDSLPAVKEARASAQYDQTDTGRQIQPQSAQAIVRSRLAAQNQLGIPEPMAVTKSEASVIARQLRSIGDDDPAGLQRFVGQLQATYGDYADEVLSATIQHQNVNRDLAVAATQVLGKLGRGRVPNPFDQGQLERASNAQQMQDALAGRVPGGEQPGAGAGASGAPSRASGPPAPLNFDPTTGATGTNYLDPQRHDAEPVAPRPGEMQGAATGLDIGALYAHRNDPAVIAEFNATYGAGTAERVIAEADRRFGELGRGSPRRQVEAERR